MLSLDDNTNLDAVVTHVFVDEADTGGTGLRHILYKSAGGEETVVDKDVVSSDSGLRDRSRLIEIG